jgi:outer membrane protein assembly factor BamB
MKTRISLAVCVVASAALARTDSAPAPELFWPQWRGPLSIGVAPSARPPLEWAEDKNVRFKVEVPGRGSSTPIVWGDLVFVTTAVPTPKPLQPRSGAAPAAPEGRRNPAVSAPTTAYEFQVLAYERKDGKLRWKTTVREEFPHEGTHQDGTFASPSAATDGERVYAFFGSRGLYCLDTKGRRLWEKELGLMRTKMSFGEGASPVLHGDRIIVNWDHEGESFILALDKKTGKELWRSPREEQTTWATPLVVSHRGSTQVITSATSRVRAYDFDTGRLVWEGPGLTPNSIPSPVAADGIVYLMSGFRGNALLAVKLAEAKGDVTGTPAIAWRYDKDTPYVPSPLLYSGGLYFLKSNSAILTRLDAATGEPHYSQRLEKLQNVYASPVGAAGRVYVVDREGATAVLEAGRELKLLAVNTLSDGFDASPAVVEGDIYLRGKRHLYCVSEATSAGARASR